MTHNRDLFRAAHTMARSFIAAGYDLGGLVYADLFALCLARARVMADEIEAAANKPVPSAYAAQPARFVRIPGCKPGEYGVKVYGKRPTEGAIVGVKAHNAHKTWQTRFQVTAVGGTSYERRGQYTVCKARKYKAVAPPAALSPSPT